MNDGLLKAGIVQPRVDYFPAGIPINYINPLDIGLTRFKGSLMGKTIGLFTNGWFSHAWICLYARQFIQEALERGVEYERATKYTNHDVAVVRLSEVLTPLQRGILLNYFRTIGDQPWAMRTRYGYTHLASIALAIIGQGVRESVLGMDKSYARGPWFGSPDQRICSGHIALGLGELGYTSDIPLAWVWPNELGRQLGVETDYDVLKKKGWING